METSKSVAETDARAAFDPANLSFIDRISWFERQQPRQADNDNLTPHPQQEEDSACFNCWAMPDFMRN